MCVYMVAWSKDTHTWNTSSGMRLLLFHFVTLLRASRSAATGASRPSLSFRGLVSLVFTLGQLSIPAPVFILSVQFLLAYVLHYTSGAQSGTRWCECAAWPDDQRVHRILSFFLFRGRQSPLFLPCWCNDAVSLTLQLRMPLFSCLSLQGFTLTGDNRRSSSRVGVLMQCPSPHS